MGLKVILADEHRMSRIDVLKTPWLFLASLLVATPAMGQSAPTAAKPVSDLALIFNTSTYPPAALRQAAQGKVGFAVEVSVDGRVSGCRITRSSGNVDLDAGTCSLMMRLARFRPATDAAGQPVAGQWASAVNWTLPPENEAPAAPPAAATAKVGAQTQTALAGPIAAQAASIADIKAQCYVGAEPPASSGSTPQHLEGVITVSPREAKCAIDRFPQLLVIAPMRDLDQLPNAVPVPLLAQPSLDPANEAKALAALKQLTAGDKNRAILVYCHHSSCGYSVNASQHLRRWGYRNVLWMREGLKGWLAARYPMTPIAKVRTPLGEPSYIIWAKPAGDMTFGCFGEKRIEACNLKVYALDRIFNAPDLPPDQRAFVAGELFNAAAVRVAVIREGKGGAAEAFPEAKLAYGALKQYAAQLGRQGVLAQHAKVVREYAINAIETGHPEIAQQVLTEVRADALAEFKRLNSVRGDKLAVDEVHGAMVSMEHLERDVADFAIEKAGTWYSADKRAEAAPYRKLAVDALDRAALWIERNGKEGVAHQMDLAPEYRLNEVLVKKGDLLVQDGDKNGARTAFGHATIICGLKDDAYSNYGRACQTAQMKYYVLTPEFERWSQQRAKQEYDRYMSLLKD